MTPLLAGAIVCAIVAMVLPWVLRPVLSRAGGLDVPNERSSHTTPVLRGGGIAVLLGMLAGVAIVSSSTLWLVTGVGAAAALLGLVDDLRDLSAKLRFGVQFLIALALSIAIIPVFGASAWFIPMIVFFFVGYVNFANFMDGIDGISALHAVVVGTAFAVSGVLTEHEWLVAAGVILALAFLAFLPWNLFGARMFIGDSGSYLLGGFIAATVVVGIAAGIRWPLMLAPLAVYTADVGWTVLRRAFKRERVWDGHREHFYQQLVDTGLSHMTVTAYVSAFTALSAAVGFLAYAPVESPILLAVIAVFFVVVFYVALSTFIVWRRKARHE